MRRTCFVSLIVALCGACGPLADDTGAADPGPSTWPWVCPDDALAPEAGCCLVGPADASPDAAEDGGC